VKFCADRRQLLQIGGAFGVILRKPCASSAERRDNVWSQNYQPVVQIFQQHPEPEPERKEIPPDQPVQVVPAMGVTPGARPKSPSQRPSGRIFDEPETADIDRTAQ